MLKLPDILIKKYEDLKPEIEKRLAEFKRKKGEDLFYELCYCICTPQTKARHAYSLETELRRLDFFNKPFDPSSLLRNPGRYIRFHNEKAKRILYSVKNFTIIKDMLNSSMTPQEKRMWLVNNFRGFGMKESSHYLRNIGYESLAILDRHILKHLVLCNVIDSIPKTVSIGKYLEIESRFLDFSALAGISMDKLDLLFWSYEAGLVLK